MTLFNVRGVAGVRGDLKLFDSTWKWDVFAQYSRSDGDYTSDVILDDAVSSTSWKTSSCVGTNLPVSGRKCIDMNFADPRVLPPLMDTSELPGHRVLVVDDVADSGRTLKLVMEMLAKQGAEARSAVLYSKPRSIIRPDYSWMDTDKWITFPWSDRPAIGSDRPGD